MTGAIEKGSRPLGLHFKLLGGDEAVAQDLPADQETLTRFDAIAREYEAPQPSGGPGDAAGGQPVCFVERWSAPRCGKKNHTWDGPSPNGSTPWRTHRIWPFRCSWDDAGVSWATFSGPGAWDVGRHRLVLWRRRCAPRMFRVAGVPPRAGVAASGAGGRAYLRVGGVLTFLP